MYLFLYQSKSVPFWDRFRRLDGTVFEVKCLYEGGFFNTLT